MYIVRWKINNDDKSFHTYSWLEALDKYSLIMKNKEATKVKINDTEYDVNFCNWQWERDSNLLGWAGREQ